MATPDSFFWYDYETFGPDPRKARPAQFAGQRTTPDLEMVGEPVTGLCAPTPDFLPVPESCLVHGLTPQVARDSGLPPTQFARRITSEVTKSGTCTAGFNAHAFDHEVTRFLFYRTLRAPYKWHYENGNSKWDLIDVARAAYAFRPDGITWPSRDDGAPSFKLERLAAANGIAHEDAHDALSDVNATVELARLLKTKKPRLFEHAFGLRDKQTVRSHFDIPSRKPFAHTSPMYPAAKGCSTLAVPLAKHPTESNKLIAYDLRQDPTHAISLSSDKLRELLFTPTEDLPENVSRPALKTLNVSKSPFVAPAEVIDDRAAQRIALDRDACRRHRDLLREHEDFADRAVAAYDHDFPTTQNVDHALYDEFIGNRDRRTLDRLRRRAPHALASATPNFNDDRLPQLFRRYVARNHPEALSDEQHADWRADCRRMISTRQVDGEPLDFEVFFEDVANRLDDAPSDEERAVLRALYSYGEDLRTRLKE